MDIDKEKTLTAADRCDRCPAQACIKATGVTGALFLCNHHFIKWEESIRKFAFEIVDERPDIQKAVFGSPDSESPHYEPLDETN